jgi:tol-pal system protein YbgF
MARRDRFDQRPEDRFVSTTYSFIDFLLLHRTLATVLLMLVVGGVLGALAYRNHVNTYNEGALAAFEEAKSVEDYKSVAETYPGSAAEPMALFYCGRKLVDDKKYDEAVAVYSSFVQLYPSHSLAPNALAFCGMLLEQEKKFEDAVTSYQSLVDRYPQSFVAPLALLNMGSCLEQLGKLPEARGTYGKVISGYPASSWKDDAHARLGKLGAEKPKGS